MNWSGLRPVVHRSALLNDPDFLNQAVTRFLQQFLEAEITTFLQAEPYQRTTDRTGYRNGYKPVKTRGKDGSTVGYLHAFNAVKKHSFLPFKRRIYKGSPHAK